MRVIAELKPTRIIIGGTNPEAIPVAEYVDLLERFPSGRELKRYVLARVASVVREYSDATVDAEGLFFQLRRKEDQEESQRHKGTVPRQ